MSENRLSVSNLTMPSWKWTQVSAIGWCCLETDAFVLNQMLPTENRRNCIGSDGTFLKRTHVSKLVLYHPIKDANVRNRTVVSKIKCWSPKTDGIDWKRKRWCLETESSVRNGRYRLKIKLMQVSKIREHTSDFWHSSPTYKKSSRKCLKL